MKRFFILSLTMILAVSSAWGDIISEVYDFKGLNATKTINRGESLGFKVNNGSDRTIYSFSIDGVEMDCSRFGGFIGGATDGNFTLKESGLLLKSRILSILNLRNGDKVKIDYKLASGGSLTLADATLIGNNTDNTFVSGTEYTISTSAESVHLDIISSSNNNYIEKITVTPYYNITVTPPTGGTVGVKVGDANVTTENTTAPAGQTITLSNTPADNYTFTSYSVTKTASGNPIELTENSFTMPGEAVTITATFTQSTPAVTEISSVEIAGLVAPEKGVALKTLSDLSTTTLGASISSITWSPKGTTAAASTAYTATIVLEASNGYQFASTVTANEIAGKTATITRTDDTHITVAYTFDETAAEQEASVSTEKTWTFNTMSLTAWQESDGLYYRGSSGRKFTVSPIETNHYSFYDGHTESLSKVATGNNPLGNNTINDATITANSNSGSTIDVPMFAFNADVAGTISVLVKSVSEAENYRPRIYFHSKSSNTAAELVVSPTNISTTDLKELKYSSSSAGSFFIGSANIACEIYAVRFVPATTIKVPTGLTGGTVTTDNSANEGEVVTLNVTPADGYQLKEGMLKAYYISTDGTEKEVTITDNKFTKPAYYVYVKAEFELATTTSYDITVTQPTGGTVGVKVGDANVTTENTTAPAGQTITLSNTPADNYTFTSYSVKKTASGDAIELTESSFTMPKEAVTITATFTQSTPAVTEISSVEIAGLVAPEKGVALKTLSDLSTTTLGASISSITWSPKGTTAAASTAYTATIVLEASNGYQFASTVTANEIAGKTATITRTDDTHITVAYTFDETAAEQEASVSTEKTWTFNTLTTNAQYSIYTEIDGAYLRTNQSGRNFTVTEESTGALTFADGISVDVSKNLAVNNSATYSGEDGTLSATSTAGDGGNAGRGMIAINATVPGTFFAKIKGGIADKVIRLYFADGNEVRTAKSVTSDGNIQEISSSSTSSGSFFAGGITTGTSNIYAVRFVPATTIKVPTDLTGGTVTADKASANEGEEVTLTVTPADGYHLKEGTLKAYYISANGTETEVTITNNKFTKPAYYVYVKAEFEEATKTDISGSVTLDGTLHWATYYAAEDLAKPEGVTVYRVTGVSGTAVQTEEVSYIKANTGVLLYSETAVNADNLKVGPGSGEDYTSTLLGTVETSTMGNGTNYVLYNNQFMPAEDNTLLANHCYLQIPGVSGTRSLTIEHGDDNTTGIHTTLKDHGDMISDIYYTLSGQRIEKPTKKGLYIVNGRKVVVK